jgi:acyl-CoA synthetase (AMP-forming)/AMP-acid ligase II
LHAAVVAQDGETLEVDDIRRHCLARLPRYAVPETIALLAELPRTSTGKTDRMSLANQLSTTLHAT